MKKSIIAMSLLALSSVVNAQTSLYGTVDSFFGQVTSNQVTTTKVDGNGLTTSFFGIRSVESIGNGLSAGIVLESFLRPDSGSQGRFATDSFFARSAYITLSAKDNELQVGRITTPYFISNVVSNAFGNSFTFSPSLTTKHGVTNTSLGAGGTDTAWNNAILFKTKLADINLSAMYSAGINDDAGDQKQIGRALNANYAVGALGLTAGYQSINSAQGRSSISSTLLGGSYDLKVAKLFAQYERVSGSDLATKEDKGWSLGLNVPIDSKNSLMLAYTSKDHTFVDNRTAETTSWALGLRHALSNRTDLYAALRDTNFNNDGVNRKGATWSDSKVVGLGVRHRF